MQDANVYDSRKLDTESFKCPSCGAHLDFSPEMQLLTCGHCGNKVDFASSADVQPIDFVTGERPKDDWNETVVYRCDNCGSREIISKNEISKKCHFCGTTNIVLTDELPGIKPGAVIPFLFNEERAKHNFKKWIKKRWFIPNKLKANAEAGELGGVYSPAWVYDCDTFSQYVGRVGQYYTVTTGSGKNRRTETRIRWRRISGTHMRDFRDYIMEASPHLDQRQMKKLAPFRMDESKVYDRAFLAGFTAAHYDRDVDACWIDVRRDIEQTLRSDIVRKHRADVVDYLNVSTNYTNVTYRYMLLPVWISNYSFAGKTYNFFVNGTTGRVIGKVPRSAAKITAFIFAIIGVLAVLAFLNHLGVFGDLSEGLSQEIAYLL